MTDRDCANCKHHTEDGCSSWDCEYEPKDLISRADAIEAVASRDSTDGHILRFTGREITDILSALPSADAVDCTDFIEWLVDRVLDETIWEYNSVAYGEIICRKLEKLGILEVTEEPSYYIRPSAEPKRTCTANFVAEQLERLKDMTDEERLKLLQTMFSSADAEQGFCGGKIPPKEMLDGTVLIPKHQWLEMERELAELKEKFESADSVEYESTVTLNSPIIIQAVQGEWIKRRNNSYNSYRFTCPKCNRTFIMPKAWGVWKGCPSCWTKLNPPKGGGDK